MIRRFIVGLSVVLSYLVVGVVVAGWADLRVKREGSRGGEEDMMKRRAAGADPAAGGAGEAVWDLVVGRTG